MVDSDLDCVNIFTCYNLLHLECDATAFFNLKLISLFFRKNVLEEEWFSNFQNQLSEFYQNGGKREILSFNKITFGVFSKSLPNKTIFPISAERGNRDLENQTSLMTQLNLRELEALFPGVSAF